jgi:hypothetical protein
MSALGQKRTSKQLERMSALPPKADICYGDRRVRFVPEADIHYLSNYMVAAREWRASKIFTLI